MHYLLPDSLPNLLRVRLTGGRFACCFIQQPLSQALVIRTERLRRDPWPVVPVTLMTPAQGSAQPGLPLLPDVELLNPVVKLPEESLHGQQFTRNGAFACTARLQQPHGSKKAAR